MSRTKEKKIWRHVFPSPQKNHPSVQPQEDIETVSGQPRSSQIKKSDANLHISYNRTTNFGANQPSQEEPGPPKRNPTSLSKEPAVSKKTAEDTSRFRSRSPPRDKISGSRKISSIKKTLYLDDDDDDDDDYELDDDCVLFGVPVLADIEKHITTVNVGAIRRRDLSPHVKALLAKPYLDGIIEVEDPAPEYEVFMSGGLGTDREQTSLDHLDAERTTGQL